MITLYGVTEDGTSVPVQVTYDGKIVAIGQPGERGPAGPQGPSGPPGEYGPGDDIAVGAITAEGVVDVRDSVNVMGAGNPTNRVNITASSGEIFCASGSKDATKMFRIQGGRSGKDQEDVVVMTSEGSITAAGNKCGFNSAGELIFTSRNMRYRCVVQGQLMVPEEYTRATELQEKAGKLREPKTQDIVPED